MGWPIFKSSREGVKKDGRLMASLSEIIDQIKLRYSPQEWSIELLFFVVRLMAWEGMSEHCMFDSYS